MVAGNQRSLVAWVTAALACVAVLCAYGLTLEALECATFSVVLIIAACIDAETRRIPNVLVLVLCAIRFAYIVVAHILLGADAGSLLATSLMGAFVIGVGLIVVTVLADWVTGKRNLGGGDIKLFASMGLFFGVSNGVAVVAIACVLSAVCSLTRFRHPAGSSVQDRTFAFGPYIAVAAIAVTLISSPMLQTI